MSITLYSQSVPVFVRMLANARTWLDKAAAYAEHKKLDPAVLPQSRLAPDMFPFSRQIQIASDHAKGAAARLQGIDAPRFEDTESTLAELQARIDKTIAFLNTASAEKMEGAEKREIVLPSPHGERRFLGEDYLRHHALPNFYFHLSTAYAILRHQGVDLGKRDFLLGAG